MRKIGLLTFHNSHNYGALLQCYSLVLKLSEFGECTVINYIRSNVRYGVISRYQGRKQRIMAIMKIFPLQRRANKIKRFIKRFPLSEKYSSETITNNHLQMDYIVTGSDQIWNCVHIDTVFFCDFPVLAKKIAYAASFGKSYIPEAHKKIVQKLLESYMTISVRERTGQRMLKEEYGIAVEWTLDPVFLTNETRWRELEKEYTIKGKYILVYLLNIQAVAKEIILELKEKMQLPVYALTTVADGKKFGADYNIISAGPEQFLWLIDHAEYVVTSSFHGMAFSIIFKKQFTVIPQKDTSERVLDLLQELELQDRVDRDALNKQIDYKEVKEKLEHRIMESEQFLDSAFKEEI